MKNGRRRSYRLEIFSPDGSRWWEGEKTKLFWNDRWGFLFAVIASLQCFLERKKTNLLCPCADIGPFLVSALIVTLNSRAIAEKAKCKKYLNSTRLSSPFARFFLFYSFVLSLFCLFWFRRFYNATSRCAVNLCKSWTVIFERTGDLPDIIFPPK